MIIAAVMAARVTPLHQQMKAAERDGVDQDGGEIALPHGAELNNCSDGDASNGRILDEFKSSQEEKAELKDGAVEQLFQASGGEKLSSKGLADKLKQQLANLSSVPGFGIMLAVLCVLWGQVFCCYNFHLILKAGAVVVKKMTLNPFLLLLWRDLLRLTTQVNNVQCTMSPLSTRNCFKSSKVRPISNCWFCRLIYKKICLNVLESKQRREKLVFVIL